MWQAGEIAEADRLAKAAVTLARNLNHPLSLAIGLWYGAFFAQMIEDAPRAHAISAELIEVSSRSNFALPLALGKIIQGWARMQDGDLAGGAGQMERAYNGLIRQSRGPI